MKLGPLKKLSLRCRHGCVGGPLLSSSLRLFQDFQGFYYLPKLPFSRFLGNPSKNRLTMSWLQVGPVRALTNSYQLGDPNRELDTSNINLLHLLLWLLLLLLLASCCCDA